MWCVRQPNDTAVELVTKNVRHASAHLVTVFSFSCENNVLQLDR